MEWNNWEKSPGEINLHVPSSRRDKIVICIETSNENVLYLNHGSVSKIVQKCIVRCPLQNLETGLFCLLPGLTSYVCVFLALFVFAL